MNDTTPRGRGIGRRTFLRRASALPLASAAGLTIAGDGQAAQQPPGQPFPGMIVRQHEPENLEFPFSTLNSFIIPNEQFYVRSHFPVPRLEARTWRLHVEGAVNRVLDLTYDDMLRFTPRTVTAVMECAGNSRILLNPRVAGLPWELGGVGNAAWTGVPLAAVLERAGVRDAAVEVILEGADTGETRDNPSPFQTPGRISFARSLPLAKARQQDVLLACRMNGADLPIAHGFPLRAVVPGWYGMASIKWLTRIIVTDRPFLGYFQTLDYAYFERRDGLATLTPITELHVKALIARPYRNEVVPAGEVYRVHGAAWTGESAVERVEISMDGVNWSPARLLDPVVNHAWRLWEYSWRTSPRPGRYTLMARATDRRGRTQPMQRDPDRRNGMISHMLPIEVDVR